MSGLAAHLLSPGDWVRVYHGSTSSEGRVSSQSNDTVLVLARKTSGRCVLVPWASVLSIVPGADHYLNAAVDKKVAAKS